MESKLPKPSSLRKPTQVPKSILPTDRIKKQAIGSLATNLSTVTSQFQRHPPLTRDPTNIQQNGIRMRGVRAVSPDITRTQKSPTRLKMRRSRSACDIREWHPMKRAIPTLAPIPAKTSRLATSNSSTASSVSSVSTISNGTNAIRPGRVVAAATATKRPAISTTRTAAATRPTAATSKTTTTTTGTTSVSTTGAGKTINKRIPPYDFKARYNDLLEKHKVLKTKFDTKCEQMGNLENLPEQVEELETQLFTTREQLENVQKENECFLNQMKSQALKIDSITSSLVKTREELERLKSAHEKVTKEHNELSTEVVELRERCSSLTEENAIVTQEITECKDQLFRSNIERKELHNTIMDLRGNIRVFCRVRPQLDSERDKMLCGWNYIDEATVEIHNSDLAATNKSAQHQFSFDHVFHARSTQDEIFEMVSPLIQSALDGYNICIFAYGQTGSGKTYTMDGIPSNVGVIPRTVDLLFDAVKNYKRLGWEYEIKVTFLEIYNEVLYDLLSNEQKDMEIRMAKGSKNDIYVSNITQEIVTSTTRLRELMQIAKMNRATACTVGNERSSRSHAVTKIELIGTHAERNEISVGSINLVDLAGSESPKTSIRMNETKNINRSLSELTNVILALLQKQDHIPYRNSKLTHLLMPSLGGNSKTLMFINVAPLLDCFVESVKSLRFAASVNSCKMTKVKRNRFLNTSAPTSNSLDKY